MQIALQDLELAHLWIVYPGHETYILDKKVTVLPLEKITDAGVLETLS